MDSAGSTPDSHPEGTAPARLRQQRPGVPSVLDLVRLSPEAVFPPGGEALYRQIALLAELEPGADVLDAACGRGVTTAFLAKHYEVDGAGLDSDPQLIQEAESRARALGLNGRLTFQCSPLDDLPYNDEIFDLSIGEVALGASFDPAAAVAELARVTKPYGSVVLVQLVWTGNIDPERREMLVQHLGARPLLLVEWKQLLRDAGCVDLHVEDWSDFASPFRPAIEGSARGISKLLTFRQKFAILRRALRKWGWRGVKGAIVREQEIQSLLTRQRVLGLSMIKSTKWPRKPVAEDL